MAILSIFFDFILIVCSLCLPFLMLWLTYGTSTKSHFTMWTVFSTGLLCVPLLVYMWIYRDALSNSGPLVVEPSAAAHDTQNPMEQSVEDLKFSDFFKLPASPRGPETTQCLPALDGKKAPIKGYMVQQEFAQAGYFMLAPLPAKTSGADDSREADGYPTTAKVDFKMSVGYGPMQTATKPVSLMTSRYKLRNSSL